MDVPGNVTRAIRPKAGKNSKRKCLRCNDAIARIPDLDPKFCSKDCGCDHAIENTGDMHWCEEHGDWYHLTDGCYDCQMAGRGPGALSARELHC